MPEAIKKPLSQLEEVIHQEVGPNKPAELIARLTKLRILYPLLSDPDQLGLSPPQQLIIAQYADRAEASERRKVEAFMATNPVEQMDTLLFRVAQQATSEYKGNIQSKMAAASKELRATTSTFIGLTPQERSFYKLFGINSQTPETLEPLLLELGILQPGTNLQTLREDESLWENQPETWIFKGRHRFPTIIEGVLASIEFNRTHDRARNSWSISFEADHETILTIKTYPNNTSQFEINKQ